MQHSMAPSCWACHSQLNVPTPRGENVSWMWEQLTPGLSPPVNYVGQPGNCDTTPFTCTVHMLETCCQVTNLPHPWVSRLPGVTSSAVGSGKKDPGNKTKLSHSKCECIPLPTGHTTCTLCMYICDSHGNRRTTKMDHSALLLSTLTIPGHLNSAYLYVPDSVGTRRSGCGGQLWGKTRDSTLVWIYTQGSERCY